MLDIVERFQDWSGEIMTRHVVDAVVFALARDEELRDVFNQYVTHMAAEHREVQAQYEQKRGGE